MLVALPTAMALTPNTAAANVAVPAAQGDSTVDTVTVNNHSATTLILSTFNSNVDQVFQKPTYIKPFGTSGWTTTSTYNFEDISSGATYDLGDGYHLEIGAANAGSIGNGSFAVCYIIDSRIADRRDSIKFSDGDGAVHNNTSPWRCSATMAGPWTGRTITVGLWNKTGGVHRVDASTAEGLALFNAITPACEQTPTACDFDLENTYETLITEPVGPRVNNCSVARSTGPLTTLTFKEGFRYTVSSSHNVGQRVTGYAVLGTPEILGSKVEIELGLTGIVDTDWSHSSTFTWGTGIDTRSGQYGYIKYGHSVRTVEGDLIYIDGDDTWIVSNIVTSAPEKNNTSDVIVGEGKAVLPLDCPGRESVTKWSSAPTAADLGQPTTLAVALSAGLSVTDSELAEGVPARTGTVTFKQGNRVLCESAEVVDDAATCRATLDSVAPGPNVIAAYYSGDHEWAPSQVVNPHVASGAALIDSPGATVHRISPESPIGRHYTSLNICPETARCSTFVASSHRIRSDYEPAKDWNNEPVQGYVAPPIYNCSAANAVPLDLSSEKASGHGVGGGIVLTASAKAQALGNGVKLVSETSYLHRTSTEQAWRRSYSATVAPQTYGRLQVAHVVDEEVASLYIETGNVIYAIEGFTQQMPVEGQEILQLETRALKPGECDGVTTTTTLDTPSVVVAGRPDTYVATIAGSNSQPVNDGTVTFRTGPKALCRDIPVVNGRASCEAILDRAGPQQVTADFSGRIYENGDHLGRSHGTKQVDVAKGGVSIALVQTRYLQGPARVVAEVVGSRATPTGTLTFVWDDGQQCRNVALTPGTSNGRAWAVCEITTKGDRMNATITYDGDANYRQSSVQAGIDIRYDSILTLYSKTPSTPAKSTEPVTYTAGVKEAAPSGPFWNYPPGTVTFSQGSQTLCRDVELDRGVARCTAIPGLGGDIKVDAAYSGSTSYRPAIASTTLKVFEPTTTKVTAQPAPDGSNQYILKATVAGASTGATDGQVDFTIDGTKVCTATVVSEQSPGSGWSPTLGNGNWPGTGVAGTASCVVPRPALGRHAVVAAYTGGSRYLPSTSAATDAVVKYPTRTTYGALFGQTSTSGKLTVPAGSSVTLVGGVTDDVPTASPQGGVLSISEGADVLCTATTTMFAIVACARTFSSIGTHEVTVSYAGDTLFEASQSKYVIEVIPPGDGAGVRMFAGAGHTCAWSPTIDAVCWGEFGAKPVPGEIKLLHSISTGSLHGCGIRADDTVKCWGGNTNGAAAPPAGTFTAVDVSMVSTNGQIFSCGIRTDKTLACWGHITSAPAGTFVSVSTGPGGACAIRTDNTVVCWGNLPNAASIPVGKYRSVSVGAGICLVAWDNSLKCIGPDVGEWGAATTGSYRDVSVVGATGCALGTTGTVTCWGSGGNPVSAAPSGSFVAIDVGLWHACGVRPGGRVECWGLDNAGQIRVPPQFASLPVQ